MEIQHFYDERTHALSYLAWDEDSLAAILIDPVLDFDVKSVRTFTESADRIAAFIDEAGLKPCFVLDTHPHADHFTALPYFKDKYGAQTVTGAGVEGVQRTFADLFHLGADFVADGSQFDLLAADGDVLEAGSLRIEVLQTPGHTPASYSYRVGDAIFVGDLLFQPDSGTARCDFPGGSAEQEYDSIQRIYAFPEETRIFTGHDYQPGGRELQYCATVAEHAAHNKHLRADTGKPEFVALRQELEKGKELPGLLFQALQVNIRGGRLPAPESNGIAYLKLPLDAF